MRALRDIPSAVFAMNPSLICGALATGKSGQTDVGSLFGRHPRNAGFKIGLTYQADSPMRLDLKLAKLPPKDTLKLRRSGSILREFSGVLSGPVLIAFGPAL